MARPAEMMPQMASNLSKVLRRIHGGTCVLPLVQWNTHPDLGFA